MYKKNRKIKKRKCDKCEKEKRTRHVIFFKGKYLCTECLNKEKSIKNSISITNKCQTLEKALSKQYKIRCCFNTKGTPGGVCSFPRVLIGKKIKIIEDEQKKAGTREKKDFKSNPI